MNNKMLNVLIIDNNDSFTYNLVEVLRKTNLCVVDVCLLENVAHKNIDVYDGAILSPGPGLPSEKNGLFDLIDLIQDKIPLLGVCLGHQALAEYYGAKIYRLQTIVHGESSNITVDTGIEIFKNMGTKIKVGRYHSWAVSPTQLPACFDITAITADNIIMSLKHRHKNIFTVQFHPESILTPKGITVLKNWLTYCIAEKL